MEHSQPHTPPDPEANRPSRSAASERSRFFDRWRKKAQASGLESQPDASKINREKSAEKPKLRTTREKFAQGVSKVVLGERRRREEPQPAQSAEHTSDPTAETEPLIDRATSIRRFARHVLNHVFGTAEAERKHGAAWDKRRAPLNTEPLIDAAEDLQDAVEDLDDAAHEYGGYSGGFDYGDGGRERSADRGRRSTETDGSFAARAAEALSRRIESLERQVKDSAERPDVRVAALRAGVGIIAVAGVILAGHEYLVHKKMRKDQKQLRTAVAQQKAESLLQKQQLEDMSRRERAAHYERLATMTHQQADTTRQVAGELHEEAQMLKVLRGPQTTDEQPAVEWRRTPLPERIAARPENDTAALATVESADTVERGPSWRSSQTPDGRFAGGTAAGGPVMEDDVSQAGAPLSPAAQKRLAEQRARAARLAANAWMYSILLVIGLLAVGLIIIFIH